MKPCCPTSNSPMLAVDDRLLMPSLRVSSVVRVAPAVAAAFVIATSRCIARRRCRRSIREAAAAQPARSYAPMDGRKPPPEQRCVVADAQRRESADHWDGRHSIAGASASAAAADTATAGTRDQGKGDQGGYWCHRCCDAARPSQRSSRYGVGESLGRSAFDRRCVGSGGVGGDEDTKGAIGAVHDVRSWCGSGISDLCSTYSARGIIGRKNLEQGCCKNTGAKKHS